MRRLRIRKIAPRSPAMTWRGCPVFQRVGRTCPVRSRLPGSGLRTMWRRKQSPRKARASVVRSRHVWFRSSCCRISRAALPSAAGTRGSCRDQGRTVRVFRASSPLPRQTCPIVLPSVPTKGSHHQTAGADTKLPVRFGHLKTLPMSASEFLAELSRNRSEIPETAHAGEKHPFASTKYWIS